MKVKVGANGKNKDQCEAKVGFQVTIHRKYD